MTAATMELPQTAPEAPKRDTRVEIPLPILEAVADVGREHKRWQADLNRLPPGDVPNPLRPPRKLVAGFEALIRTAAEHAPAGRAPFGCGLLYLALQRFAKSWLDELPADDAHWRSRLRPMEEPEISGATWSAWNDVQLAVERLQSPIERREIESMEDLHRQGVAPFQIAVIHGLPDAKTVLNILFRGGALPANYTPPGDREFAAAVQQRLQPYDARQFVQLAREIATARSRIDEKNQEL